MKKFLLILTVVAFVGTVLSSCKSQERCPAYGKTTSNTKVKSV